MAAVERVAGASLDPHTTPEQGARKSGLLRFFLPVDTESAVAGSGPDIA
jgi:hypothetical protein